MPLPAFLAAALASAGPSAAALGTGTAAAGGAAAAGTAAAAGGAGAATAATGAAAATGATTAATGAAAAGGATAATTSAATAGAAATTAAAPTVVAPTVVAPTVAAPAAAAAPTAATTGAGAATSVGGSSMRSVLGRVKMTASDIGASTKVAAQEAWKDPRVQNVVRESFAPGSTGHPSAGFIGSAIRKTGQEIGQAVGQFADQTAMSQNDVSAPRDSNYTPYTPFGPVQGQPIGIPEDKEHLYRGREQGSAGSTETPTYEAPAVNTGSSTPMPSPRPSRGYQYVSPESRIYGDPPADPYVQGMGDPFARRPQFGADPFAGSRSTYRPPEPPGRGANPFERPGANPFEVDPHAPPKILGRTAPQEDRVPGPIPSRVYPRGGDVGNIRNVLGDAAEVMNRRRAR